jgi:hypothetical protein
MPEARRRTATWRALGNFLVFVHGTEAPSETEWDELLALFRAVPDITRVRVLVFTLGGAPDARQRARLNQILAETKPPIAVLTPSALARAAGTAISWFNPRLRVFDPDDIERALDHLDAVRADRQALVRAVAELRREMHI